MSYANMGSFNRSNKKKKTNPKNNKGDKMHKFNQGDICIFTNRSITEITGNDGKNVRITKLLPADMYEIEFLNDDKCFGARENELTLVHKEIFPRLCPRCQGNISDHGIDRGQEITQCPHCLYKIKKCKMATWKVDKKFQ